MQFITANWKDSSFFHSHKGAQSYQNMENILKYVTVGRLKCGIAVHSINIHLHMKLIIELSIMLFLLSFSPHTHTHTHKHTVVTGLMYQIFTQKMMINDNSEKKSGTSVGCLLLIIETGRDKDRSSIQILIILSYVQYVHV